MHTRIVCLTVINTASRAAKASTRGGDFQFPLPPRFFLPLFCRVCPAVPPVIPRASLGNGPASSSQMANDMPAQHVELPGHHMCLPARANRQRSLSNVPAQPSSAACQLISMCQLAICQLIGCQLSMHLPAQQLPAQHLPASVGDESDVQFLQSQSAAVPLNQLPAGAHLAAHEQGKHVAGLGCVVNCQLAQRAGLWV